METFEWLVAVSAAFSLLSTLGFISLWIKSRRQAARFNALVNVLKVEIRAMNNASIGVGHRVVDIEKKLNIAVEKQSELESRDPDALAYSQASQLMEKGATVSEVIASCGIGRPEAELMALLHKELGSSPRLNQPN